MSSSFGIAIHGGAGVILREKLSPKMEKDYRAKLTESINAGIKILKSNGPSLDAVQQAILVMEDSDLFNAGKGAVFTHDGTNEMDASIMCGKTHQCGAVAGVTHVKNPILLADKVRTHSDHIILGHEGAEAFAKKHGYVETLLGRKRHFPHLLDDRTSGNRVAGQLRAAINMPIQGTAADILKIAMIKLHEELENSSLDAAMILQVHDELVLEVAENQVEETTRLVVDTMQNAYELRVPLVANADVGQNWRDMEAI